MASEPAQIRYNEGLGKLEELLSNVRRPGDYFVHGAMEMPMPKVEIDGVGVLSFPVPAEQIRELIRQATRAPYGRGSETILDTAVRKVWQVAPEKVRIGGRSWANTFQTILTAVIDGLGCRNAAISAELYKFLIYDEGGFFLAHRDTEKGDGMFGTLVVVLPSFHTGGELVIRHAGREVSLDINPQDVSELRFAAFYADCEHEVRPVLHGSRVCLVYNLLQRRGEAGSGKPLTAPLYESEVASARAMLEGAMNCADAPAKIAWLLEHQYSPAGLSFAALKNADSAVAKVLCRAASQAGCAAHLAIIHIEESGSAQPVYDGYRGIGWRDEEDVSSGDFEVVDVDDARHYVDHWIDSQGQAMPFGEIPLEDGELLPKDGLDGEEPDEQRLMEASGNAGVSYERAYHRAGLVIWRRDRFADVLLQAGVGAVLPHLEERIHRCLAPSAPSSERDEVVRLAGRVIDRWNAGPWSSGSAQPDRSRMAGLLTLLGEAALLENFLADIVTPQYDGSENDAVAAALRLLGSGRACELFSSLVRANMRWFAGACVSLLRRLIEENVSPTVTDWTSTLQKVAAVVVEALPDVSKPELETHHPLDWARFRKSKPADAAFIADLLDGLRQLDAGPLRERAARIIAGRQAAFDPGKVVVPALQLLHVRHGNAVDSDPAFLCLWMRSSEFLLGRSEFPPEAPADWRQQVQIPCRCVDCRVLQEFLLDPTSRIHRFRVRENRRLHLHQIIEQNGLDMIHETERSGSPHTLVCTKTRNTHLRRCDQHRADIASLAVLAALVCEVPTGCAPVLERIAAARNRART